MAGKLALLRAQRARSDESAATESRRAEEESQKRVLLAQRKLNALEERRRFMERDLQVRTRTD